MKKNQGVYGHLRRIILAIGSLVVISVIWLGGIAVNGLLAQPHKSAVGVIFGTAVTDDGVPKPALRERLQEGLKLWQDGVVSKLMVSGAVEHHNHKDEARIMAQWLEVHGVPSEVIIVDSHGNNTWLTGLHVAALKAPSAVVITQWFHVARAQWALRRAGVASVSGAWPRHFRMSELWYLFREGAAFPVYIVTKVRPEFLQ
ncbi:YdcF family protein [Gluconobacter wancherniae]|uniref:DUF218 domain-containing protein n=1 Tax=Gluconobacter wancherniae NBRC 103581 TaxID=656744 RepID=A0A511B2J7_9PROT|nr:YdcF family protein [Gluconobacter wancherniae]GBD57804.1 hypothetical protein NBRC103581_02400 [Gluconobacter wancherniae NBRC 103581]GEK94670.1 hypothetical protein GWA01_24400 [Gluconobacter wancherniae NBRC 103581]